MFVHRVAVLFALGLVLGAPGSIAKQAKGIKGRHLVVEDGARLSDHQGASVVVVPAEIVADKDRPVDVEAVRTMSDQSLSAALKESGFFADVLSSEPATAPPKLIRCTTQLSLQFGSQAMRFFVGSGAGKSKLHMVIDFTDVASGKRIARYNGYGTGAGLMSLGGGNVQRMAGDDFQENHRELIRQWREQAR